MSLSALGHRKLPVQTPAGNTIADWLTSIAAAFASATYYDGAARTPGSGSAHTVNVKTESVEGISPNSGTGSLLHYRWVIGGSSSARTPKMCATPADTTATNTIHASIAKASGAMTWVAWDDATSPWTGTGMLFFGYWRSISTAITVSKIHCYESQDTAWVLFEDSTGLMYPILLGPRAIDPDSTSTSDVETANDAALSCLHTGAATAIPVAFAETQQNPAAAASNFLHHHTTINTTFHFGAFQPGSGTILNCFKQMVRSNQAGTSSIKLRSGRFAKVPFTIQGYLASPDDRTFGRLREVCMFGSATHGQVLRDGGVDIGYVISRSTASNNPSILLLY